MGNESNTLAVIKSALVSRRKNIEEALPLTIGIRAEQFQWGIMNAFSRNPELLECTMESIVSSMYQSVRVGLSPDPFSQLAYFVPQKMTDKNSNPPRTWKECQLRLMYKGVIELFSRAGYSVRAAAVYEKDVFGYSMGIPSFLNHTAASGKRGNLTHSYAIAEHRDGRFSFFVCDKEMIERARMKSPKGAKGWGFWGDDYEAGAVKTAIHRLAKFCPMSIEHLEMACNLEQIAAAGKRQPLLNVEADNVVDVYEVVDAGDSYDDSLQLEDNSNPLVGLMPEKVEEWCDANGAKFPAMTPEEMSRCSKDLRPKR